MCPIRQALISVSDKTGVVELARALSGMGVNILSTGGTAKLLAEAGVRVTEVGDYTGFPEMLDGRVKTLHPKIHGGLLARRDVPAHMDTIREAGIGSIDMLVVNLYPFEATVAKSDCTLDEAIENIDIGGPAMVRSAAKNWKGVAVLTDPEQYAGVLAELRECDSPSLNDATRFALASAAFNRISNYDAAISDYISSIDSTGTRRPFSDQSNGRFVKLQDLRYGENPHQKAAFYRDLYPVAGTLAMAEQLQGKELSYNNIADADAAWECVKSFADQSPLSACVIIKHANPCGVALGANPSDAYEKALKTDPTSAFGGIIAFNMTLDGAAAAKVAKQFVEVLIAPEFSTEALAIFSAKPNTRLLRIKPGADGLNGRNSHDTKRVGSGLLIQTADNRDVTASEFKTVSKRIPTASQIDDLLFAWRVAKFVKSNAIVFCAGGMTLGVGAGQMSRIDSARIASIKAQNAGLTLHGSVVASDAFFPFRDGLDVVAEAGAVAVVQPGGSVRDDEVIAAADERGIAMVYTGIRHFRH
jgi:phosphoribosylaminoimidazolecarboxamide formyltransferase/IMP cyclohydrolase